MTASLEQYTRARSAALVGLLAQGLATAALVIGGAVNQSAAMLTAGLLAGSGVLIWLALFLVYWAHVAERQEDLEAEQLRRQRVGAALFEGEDVSLRQARKRLAAMHRYLLPAFALVVAVYNVGMAVLAWQVWLPGGEPADRPLPSSPLAMAGLCGLILAFVLFLISRYASGLARLPYASLLRAGSSSMFLTALASLACCIGLVLVDAKLPRPEQIIAQVFPWVLVVLGAEAVLTFVLDLYRPRSADAPPHASFESRLSTLLSEPTGLAGTIAESLNYQFGFEISKTWFYGLLQRSFPVLVAFQLLTLLALTCITVIPAGSVGIVEHLGRPRGVVAGADGRLASPDLLQPGLHFKCFWPVQTVRKVDLDEVRSLTLGLVSAAADGHDHGRVRAVLWTDENHGATAEQDLVVARRPDQGDRPGHLHASQPAGGSTQPGVPALAESVPVSIVRARVEVLYQVNDALAFTYSYADPLRTLEAIANREFTQYLATTDVDRLLGVSREAAAERLRRRINLAIAGPSPEAQAEGVQTVPSPLGLQISYVGFLELHPPQDLAASFEGVVSAQLDAQAAVKRAWSEATRVLAEAAGTREAAEQLAALIARYTQAQAAGDTAQLSALAAQIEQTLETVGGQASSVVSAARAERWETEMGERGKAESYATWLSAYRVGPALFMQDQIARVLTSELPNRKKYFKAFESDVVKLWVDLQDPPTAGLIGTLNESN